MHHRISHINNWHKQCIALKNYDKNIILTRDNDDALKIKCLPGTYEIKSNKSGWLCNKRLKIR